MERFAVWQGLDEWRVEVARVRIDGTRLAASGVQVAGGAAPYRLDYALETGERFVTRSLQVGVEGPGWRRSLRLARADDGTWSAESAATGEADLPPPASAATGLGEALDCDLGLSPITNLMPIRRDDLHREPGAREITVGWVAVPELTVVPARQLYEHLHADEDGSVVRFRSLDGEFAGFEAELELDRDGLVTLYPELARRAGELKLPGADT